MNKESWKNVREVATVTAVGAAEGALIGAAMLNIPGAVSGGLIGGLTALTAELIGRKDKVDVRVSLAITKQTPTGEKTQTETKHFPNTPSIQTRDKAWWVIPEMVRQALPVNINEPVHVIAVDMQEKKTDKNGVEMDMRRTMTIRSPIKELYRELRAKST